MRTTFINQNSEKTIYEDGLKHLGYRSSDIEYYMNVGTEGDRDELREYVNRYPLTFAEIRELIKKSEDLGPFYEYGLNYDYVELGTFNDQQEDYFRFQISWGGPSEEVRFYEDGKIEFVYLDWFSGVGFDVTREDWAIWLNDWFAGCGMMDFQEKREGYDYFEQLDRIENPEEYAETEDEEDI